MLGLENSLQAQDQFFSLADGGVVCPDHVRASSQVLGLNLTLLKTLRYLQTRDYAVIKVLRLDSVLHMDLERLLQNP